MVRSIGHPSKTVGQIAWQAAQLVTGRLWCELSDYEQKHWEAIGEAVVNHVLAKTPPVVESSEEKPR